MPGRPKNGSSGLAPLESAVMDVIWASDAPVSVREVLEALNARRPEELAYTTVMTVMNRLVAKNVLRREGTRRRYRYEATATDVAAIAMRDVIRTHGDAAIAQFVTEAKADPELLDRLRALLEPRE
ncbi:MAG: BlaI/MecI/CopY family transcriptional regulator [Streptosporangiaceae bacterium]